MTGDDSGFGPFPPPKSIRDIALELIRLKWVECHT